MGGREHDLALFLSGGRAKMARSWPVCIERAVRASPTSKPPVSSRSFLHAALSVTAGIIALDTAGHNTTRAEAGFRGGAALRPASRRRRGGLAFGRLEGFLCTRTRLRAFSTGKRRGLRFRQKARHRIYSRIAVFARGRPAQRRRPSPEGLRSFTAGLSCNVAGQRETTEIGHRRGEARVGSHRNNHRGNAVEPTGSVNNGAA